MKNTIRMNHDKKQIVMDRTFAKLAENVRSEEYAILQQVRQDYPKYKVVQREIAKNPGKESYKGLTYEYMRNYIIAHTSAEEELAALAEFDEMLLISECHSKSRRYPVIKKWFLEKYSEVAQFGVKAS